MARFGANTQELRSIASELEGILGSEYDRVVANMNQHAQDIGGKWRGEAQREFETQMQETDAYLKQIRALITAYVELLRTAATKYDQADEEASGIMRRLNA